MNYLNAGNIFSKSLFIKDLQKNIILISKEENINKYLKIFDYINFPIYQIQYLSDLIDCCYNTNNSFIVSPEIFYTKIENKFQLEKNKIIYFKKTGVLNIDDLIKKLNDFGYKFNSDFLDLNNYNKTGDIINIKLKNNQAIYKISFFDNIIENIFYDNKEIDEFYIGKIEKIDYFDLSKNFNFELIDILNKSNKTVILDELDIYNDYKNFDNLKNKICFEILKDINKKQENLETFDLIIENIENLINLLKDKEKNSIIYTKNPKTIQNFLNYNNLENIEIKKTDLTNLKSFKTPNKNIICDDNLSRIFIKKRIKKSLSENLDLLLQIKPGDYVVHREHGIGIFHQIIKKENLGIKREYLEIHYKDNDKLYVPITEIKRISKYIGTENPELTGLNTKTWSKKIEKIENDIKNIALELLEIYAKRKITPGFSFDISNSKIIDFQRSFEYEYTQDQIQAIQDIFKDMEKPNPMERLLVGDVGFGKTEVAFNAIMVAFLNKKQSVFISPLIVLAYEHWQKAISRFKNFGLKIEILTRIENSKKTKQIIEKLKNGEIDLIFGTHKLLNNDIQYKNLGLLIIDEEHKFGVKQKEKIKSFYGKIDILSMSATPIPRSLNMAFNGIKDISILTKPPLNRKGVETFVAKFDDNIIKDAVKKEFDRDGQVFFIHNRIETIDNMFEYLKNLFPTKKIIITHGQLPGNELENRIIDFKHKKYDILLSSTVIENGIDFPNVNTIIINDAYKFGISQIHQLRGRVGRGDKKGYCYLLFSSDKIKEDAAKRLQTIVEYSHLGAGFELAVRDLEIRGSGDILGIKQSGNTSEIGINLFLKMLEEKIEELKSNFNFENETKEFKQNKIETSIDLNIEAYLEDDFFENDLDKINFYKEIESISSLEELDNLIQDFKEIKPNLTEKNLNLFKVLKVRIMASGYKIKSIFKKQALYKIIFDDDLKIEELKKFLILDKKVVFIVESINTLKCSCLKFRSDQDFLNYLEDMLEKKL